MRVDRWQEKGGLPKHNGILDDDTLLVYFSFNFSPFSSLLASVPTPVRLSLPDTPHSPPFTLRMFNL